MSVSRDRLNTEPGAIVEAAYYYNTCVLPEYTCLLQLAENPFITAFLLFSDSRQFTSPDWFHHFTAALEMITLRGGVGRSFSQLRTSKLCCCIS